MIILLDIDGVLVTTPSWKPSEISSDGFLSFNERAAKNLARLVDETNAAIVLTTTHRINYSIEQWKTLLHTRGINPASISKINNIEQLAAMPDRATEIKNWIDNNLDVNSFVVIDDDTSINRLPEFIKRKCVITKSMIGLDDEATVQALRILYNK